MEIRIGQWLIEAASDCGDRAGQEMWVALLVLEAEESDSVFR